MPPTKLHLRTPDWQRQPVRAGPLEKRLDQFNEEISTKTSILLAHYDREFVKPLRQRLDWLETPLLVRAWIVTRRAVTFVVSGGALAWWKARRAARRAAGTKAQEAPTEEAPPPAAPEPEATPTADSTPA